MSVGSAQVKRLVFIGRLASIQKRPAWMIEIARILLLPVLFIGDGEEFEYLASKAELNAVPAEFLGHQLDPWSFTTTGDLIIVPSSFEGDGLVAIEAISRRIPIILADIPDFRRFQLSEVFYASTIEDFASRILEEKLKLANFVVPDLERSRILDGRGSINVGDTWVKLFQEKRGGL